MTMLVTLNATLVTVRVAQPKTPRVTAVPPNEVKRAPPMAFLSGGRDVIADYFGASRRRM